VAADLAEAERWYLKLALDGQPEAQFRLGRMKLALPSLWRAPEAEVRDDQWTGAVWYTAKPEADGHVYLGRPGMLAAERWLTAAAEQGHAEAAYLLGSAKLAGLDLPFDLTEAVTYLEMAAEKGHVGALMTIARLATKGQGFFGKDPIRAWVGYDLAAQLGRKDAETSRELLSKTMSARQVSRARQLSQEIRDMRGM
jgi:TPR repeat protein